MVHLDIEGSNRAIVIASAYFTGDGITPPPSEVRELVRYCSRKNLPLLVGCDANAHHVMWGSTDVNERGLLWIYILQLGFMAVSLEPGFLDFDNLPDTNFTCVGRVVGGYYADTATSCQMFHVCTLGQNNETMDIRFLCLNGTVFEQATRVCERIDEVDCEKSEQYYHLNNELYGGMDPLIIRGETDNAGSSTTPSTTTTTTTTPKPSSTNPYYATIKQTTIRQKISPHYTSDSPADIRFDPKIINLQLNSDPSLGVNIKPVSYQEQHYNDDETHHSIMTTHSYKNDVPKVIYNNYKGQNLKASDINYEFDYHDQDQYNPERDKSYLANIQGYPPSSVDLDDYTDDIYKGSTYRTIYKTTPNKKIQQGDSATYKIPITFTSSSSNPQSQYSFERTEIPVKQQITAPPSIFSAISSPAPFSHPHHMETKRNTDHHKIKKSFSLSISDQNGKELVKVNNTPISDIFPGSYLDYNDDDVTLIPVFQDVPKLHRQKRSTETSRVFKADPDATDVLKFLLNWYTNYDKTTKIAIPLTSETIHQINDELSVNDGKNVTNALRDEQYEDDTDTNVSELKKRENDYYDEYYYDADNLEDNYNNNTSNVIISRKELESTNDTLKDLTESKKNSTTILKQKAYKNENGKNDTFNYLDEYVDDNYEPITYNKTKDIKDLNETLLDVNELPIDITTISNKIYDYVDDNYETFAQINNSKIANNISITNNVLLESNISLTTEYATTTDPYLLPMETTTEFITTENNNEIKTTINTSHIHDFNLEAVKEVKAEIPNNTQHVFQVQNSNNSNIIQSKIEDDEIASTTDNYKNLETYSSTMFDIASSITTSESVPETTTLYVSTLLSEETIPTTDMSPTKLTTIIKPDNIEVPTSTDNTLETTATVSEITSIVKKFTSTVPSKIVSMVTENLNEMIKDIEIETKSVAATIIMPQPKIDLSLTSPKVEDSVTEYLDVTTQSIPASSEPLVTTTYIPISITTPKLIETSTDSNIIAEQQTYSSRKPVSSRHGTHRFNFQQNRRYDRRRGHYNTIIKEQAISNSVNHVNTEKLNISKNVITTARTINNNTQNESVRNTQASIKENQKYFPALEKMLEESITDPSLSKSANPTLAKATKNFLPTTPISKHIRIKFRKEKINKKYIFTCFDKAINKFYSDPRDCRLFHYCSQGYTSNQLVDMKFVCDLGTYFDDIKLICTEDKPARCL